MKTSKLSESMEDYLEAIFLLEQKSLVARPVEISKMLGVRMPSVSSAIRKLSKLGYVNYKNYGYITLSDKGKVLAKHINRRHTQIKSFLQNVLNIPDGRAEKNACRMEHAMDKEVSDRLASFVDFIQESDKSSVNLVVFRKKMKNS